MKRLLALLPLFALQTFATPLPIFDGKTLDGWETPTPALWKVEEGCITGGDGTTRVPHNDFLCTKASYSNFILRMKIKLTGDPKTGLINSGIQIRSARIPNHAEVSGYQCDYGDADWWGAIYDEGRRDKLIAKSDMAALDPVLKRGDWNEYVIRAEGPRVQTWINGVQGVDYREADANIAQDGIIGIQVHGGGNAKIQVRDITLEELPPTAGAPTWDKVGRPGEKKAAASEPKKEGTASDAGQAKTPQEELATFKVPDGFEVELVAAEDPANGIGKFVPIAFDQKGALWTTTALEYPVDGNENPAAADALYASKGKDKVLVYDRDPRQPTGYSPKPRIFADGLAIPLGVLPYKNGCYVQHGHDIVFLEDTDADGKADKRTVILSGFGVQDSHLFPHQFLRAPGGWIWMAQGLFNTSAVKTSDGKTVEFDMCRMAKFRPDGTQFEPTSVGPNNIWGLVLNGEGEAFIQEANDYGYPVMPFHEYAYYPGGAESLAKSYQPPFPPTAEFRMGGTGLSGLALTDKAGPFPEPWRDVMLVANPITNRIQAIKMHRDGPRWRLEQLPDFLTSGDPWFRPVAISVGPDGYLYIVDWYNKIISHNEVSRNHPDRDKTRGRIWRVKAKATKPFDVPDFTKLSGDELIAKLGSESLAQSHLAWQAIEERGDDEALEGKLDATIRDVKNSPARRIQALWAMQGVHNENIWTMTFPELARDENPAIRRALARMDRDSNRYTTLENAEELQPLMEDPDPVVRATIISAIGNRLGEGTQSDSSLMEGVKRLVYLAKAPLPTPLAPSTHNSKSIKVREAYDRDFERYLIRQILERVPRLVATLLDSPGADILPIENRMLAALALAPNESAGRVALLLPDLQRAPNREETLRLAQFADSRGVGDALAAALTRWPDADLLPALIEVRAKLDATKLRPILTKAATEALIQSTDEGSALAVRLAGAFQLETFEPILAGLANGERAIISPERAITGTALVKDRPVSPALRRAALRALAEMSSGRAELFATLAKESTDQLLRHDALTALTASRNEQSGPLLLGMWPQLTPVQRRAALDGLAVRKSGAQAIVAAVKGGTLPKTDLDGAIVEKLQAVLSDSDAGLASIMPEMVALFRPVLALDGTEDAWTDADIALPEAFTIETWVRLDPTIVGRSKIDNSDGILGVPGALDFNFFDAKLRAWVGGGINDAIVSEKPMVPKLWTHVAIVGDWEGFSEIYQDGELASSGEWEAVRRRFEHLRIGWTGPKGGTAGALSEFRIWNRKRTADEIRATFDRSYEGQARPGGLVFYATGAGSWGKLSKGAKIVKTNDFPPILTADEAAALDARYAKLRALAEKPGDIVRGKAAAALCQSCHLMGPTGGNIGPNLSGVGAMGTEAILRNILQPNAAMENGYRIYRVELKSGDLVDAFFVSEDKDAVVVRIPGSEDRRIAKTDIREAKYLRRSLMPEGLLDSFTPEQVSDLFAYLKSLK